MDYYDDFYTDEPIGLQGDTAEGDSAARWDYVAPSASPSASAGRAQSGSWFYRGENVDSAPKDIQQMVGMIQESYWSLNTSKNFYDQALFMAGYADDAPIVPFHCYYPSFRQMTVSQLRSYFTVRKLLRQGQHPDVPLSYLFVYAYETIMQIGISDPEEGYEILCDLRDSYPEMDKGLRPYVTEWIRDYVVWYGLPARFAECFAKELLDSTVYNTVGHYATATDDELFATFDCLSRHFLTKSPLYKKQPQAIVAAVARVVRSLAPILEKKYNARLTTLVFGKWQTVQHTMFDRAVFYSPTPITQASVTVSPTRRFVCDNGCWKEQFAGGYILLTRNLLKAILHDTDALVRVQLGVKPTVRRLLTGGLYSSVIGETVGAWAAEWKASESERRAAARREAIEQARRSVSIDLSLLGKIREDADVVRDKLIIDEGQVEEEASVAEPPTTPAPPTIPDNPAAPSPALFVSILLSGGDYKAYLRETHTMAGVIVEEINNRAMDIIGDIVLEDDGTEITVIEDYRDDIKHLYD